MVKTFDGLDSLNPLLGKIVESFGDFDDYSSVNNAYRAAVWCYNKGMFQQSATILQETVVTFFCRRHGLNELVEEDRRVVNVSIQLGIIQFVAADFCHDFAVMDKRRNRLARKKCRQDDYDKA